LDDLKWSFNSYEEQWNAYKNDWWNYSDQWEELFSYLTPDDELPPDSVEVPNIVTVKENVEYLVVGNALMEENNSEETIQTLWPEQAKSLQDVMSYTTINVNIDDPRVDSFEWKINISSTRDVGAFLLRIKTIGNECFSIDWVSSNLCEDPYEEIDVNPFLDPKELSLSLSDNHSAGRSVLSFELCLRDQPTICVKKTEKINILPWSIAKENGLVLSMPNDKVLVWATLPMIVNAYDDYGNGLWQTLYNYELSVDSWKLDFNGIKWTGFVFSDLTRKKFVYQAPNSPGNINVKLYPQDNDDLPRLEWNIDVVNGKMSVYFSWKIVDEEHGISLKLPYTSTSYYKYIDSFGIEQVNLDNLPKISISLKEENGDRLNAWISVLSSYGLVVPWEITSSVVTIQQNGLPLPINKYKFSSNSTFWIQDGQLDVYFYPGFDLGVDELVIAIPGTKPLRIPIEITASDPSQVILKLDKKTSSVDEEIFGELLISDIRDNISVDPVSIIMEAIWPVRIDGKKKIKKAVVGWKYDDFKITTMEPWGQWFVIAYIDTWVVPLDSQWPWIAEILVQKPMIPEDDLNVMYLNLFGSDWWNQWWYFSLNNKKINDIFANSPKLISATTQLINPQTLWTTKLVISENWLIKNIAGIDIYFGFDVDNKYNYFMDGIWIISFDQDFVLYTSSVAEFSDNAANNIFDNGQSSIMYFPNQLDSVIYSNDVRNNSIYVNDKKIFSPFEKFISSWVLIKLADGYLNWYPYWDLLYQEENIGKFILWTRSDSFIKNDGTFDKEYLSLFDLSYDLVNWFYSASSNGPISFALVKNDLSYPINRLAYDSIESSNNTNAYVWFRWDFKNITLFAGWESVGDATKPFSSHFLINFWDPLVKRVSTNEFLTGTHFDGGVGVVLASTPDKSIMKVLDMDFNNDWLKDLISVYTDGTVRIYKNYWGRQSFKPMQDLMVLAGWIKDVFAWDVDGNGYDDLIISTTRNTVRVYTNDRWVFDVDWYPVCLNTSVKWNEITDSPGDLFDVNQIYFKYMDESIGFEHDNLDKTLDIVTHDSRGDIKIFYGGSTNWRPNYLSTLKYTCDANRHVAQDEEMEFIRWFGLRINSNQKIQDWSLVHWNGLKKNNSVDTWESILLAGLDPEMSSSSDDMSFSDIMSFLNGWDGPFQSLLKPDTTSEFFDDRTTDFLRLQVSPIDRYPIYENLNPSDIYYVPLWYLSADIDPVMIYKTYDDLNGDILEDWDEVMVHINIESRETVQFTYIDQLLWPWYLNTDDLWTPEDFSISWFSNAISDLEFIWDLSSHAGYQFIIDDLRMNVGDKIEISYLVRYKQTDTIIIWVEDREISQEDVLEWSSLSLDNYNDIIIKPVDWCAKAMWILSNAIDAWKKYRSYNENYVDIAKLMADYVSSMEANNADVMSSVTNIMNDIGWENTDPSNPLSSLPWMEGIFEDAWVNELLWDIMWSILSGENINFNTLLDLGGAKWDVLSKKLDDLMKWTCEWFKLWSKSCQWLPLPFNVDLLSPWEFNVFGCSVADFNGIPLIFAPGTMPMAPSPIPGPPNFMWWIMKMTPFDSFLLWPGWWLVPSMIRVYVTMTLTMQVWVSICFWPMPIWKNMPPIAKDLWWNCIVLTVPLPCGWDGDDEIKPAIDVPYWMLDAGDAWTCNRVVPVNIKEWTYSSSSLQIVTSSPNSIYPIPAVPAGSYFAWMINFETLPSSWVGDEDSPMIDLWSFSDAWEKIIIGPEITNKIIGGMKNGLMSCVIDWWLDKQIKYILNNLNKMTISIVFPDVSDLFKWFDKLAIDNLMIMDSENSCKDNPDAFLCVLKNERDEDKKAWYIQDMWEIQKKAKKDPLFDKISKVAYNSSLKKDSMTTLWNEMSNPFEAIQTMFNEVELVNIETKNVIVKVPMIYGEDLVQYINQMKSRLETNQKILTEWTHFFQSTISFCVKKWDEWWLPTMDEVKNELWNGWDGAKRYPVLKDRVEFVNYLLDGWDKIWITDVATLELWESELLKESNQWSIVTLISKLNNFVDKNVKLTSSEIEILQNSLDDMDQELWKLQSCIGFFAVDANWRSKVSDFIDFETNTSDLINSIRRNIEVLEEYKKFPLELYEWMHVTDRYLSELTSILSDFVATITRRMNDNAERYSSYVDAIITMIGAVKTWQVLVDLSKNRSSKCSTCTTDTYDSYSCKLSLLCPDLPVLPIPPFKIPNIFIDLSDIDLWIDITLPEFKFQPQSFILPKLPNIPHPPTMEFNYNFDAPLNTQAEFNFDILWKLKWFDFGSYTIPSFPIFPAPPELPEIPSFLPTIHLSLPVLPPAPEIPDIIPEIDIAIDVADWIWKILCITKWNIGLVSENAIKSKVEQMTQRTYDVPIFDSFDQDTIQKGLVQKQIDRLKEKLAKATDSDEIKKFEKLLEIAEAGDAPLKWFDYKIDSHVELKFNFDQVFEFIDAIADNVNNFSDDIYSSVQNKISDVSEVGIGFLDNMLESGSSFLDNSIESGLDIVGDQVNEWSLKVRDRSKLDKLKERSNDAKEKLEEREDYEVECLNNLPDQKLKILEKSTYEDLKKVKESCNQSSFAPMIPANDARKKLIDGLVYAIDNEATVAFTQKFSAVKSFVEQDSQFYANYDELLAIEKASQSIIDKKQWDLRDVENLIKNNYDEFIKNIQNKSISLVADDKEFYSFSMSIFDVKDEIADAISKQEDPRLSYLKLQENEVDGYLKSLETHSPMQLQMTQTEYNKDKDYFYSVKNSILQTKPLFSNVDSGLLLAQWDAVCITCWWWDGWKVYSPDLSQYVNWIMIDGLSSNKVSIVLSETFVDAIENDYYQVDLNNDGNDDVLMWDRNNIYVKYYNQDALNTDGNISTVTTNYYKYSIDSWDDLKSSVDEFGYDEIGNRDTIILKLYDNYREVKNFKLKWQSFEQISFSRLNSRFAGENPDAYVIQFNLRSDTFYDSEESYFDNSNEESRLKNKKYILIFPNNVIPDVTWMYVDFYDGNKGLVDDLMTGVISQIKWFDPNKNNIIISLTDIPRNWLYAEIATLNISDITNDKFYERNSPWSNQIVAWRQIMWDIIGPEPEITLHRIMTNEVLSTWTEHNWYVSTNYSLHAFWKDNIAMDHMWIQYGDDILVSGDSLLSTWIIELTWLFYTGKTNEKYVFAANDINWNTSYEEINLHIDMPNIEIVNINQLSENSANIIAKIEHDMDEWSVVFEKNRYGFWNYLTWTNDSINNWYTLNLWQTIITGSVYDVWNDLAIYDNDWNVVATLNPKNWRLLVDTDYKDKIELRMSFDDFIAKIEIFDKESNSLLFWVTLPPKKLVDIKMFLWENLYKLVDLENASFARYRWGYAVVAWDQTILMYISPKWNIYVPQPANLYLKWDYIFDEEKGTVSYLIKDELWVEILRLELEIEPFL